MTIKPFPLSLVTFLMAKLQAHVWFMSFFPLSRENLFAVSPTKLDSNQPAQL